MHPIPVPKLLEALSGDLLRGPYSGVVTSVTTDSRGDVEGRMFVPLVGESFDGHEFIGDVAARGALGALTMRPGLTGEWPKDFLLIGVKDTLAAYQTMASLNRDVFTGPVIGITGSCGKTTTKNMVRNILSLRMKTVCTDKNENNEIGVSHTLLRIDRETEAAALEFGMRGPGEIDLLARIARPDIGCVTNVEKTHIGRLGSEEAIAAAKGELLDHIQEKGVAILNADNRWTREISRRRSVRVATFGLKNPADVYAEEIQTGFEGTTFILRSGSMSFPIDLSLPGKVNVYNALAAAAIALQAGIGPDAIAEGLRKKIDEGSRFRRVHTKSGLIVLDDSYNSNPASLAMALEMLSQLPWTGRKAAVLGDMLELGDYSADEHRKIGARWVPKNCDALIAFGLESREIAEGAIEAGMDRKAVMCVTDFDEFTARAKDWFTPSDLILVKGSRGMRLERVVEWLMER